MAVYLILNNIRSVHNVGSIFRTADSAGVTKIFLLGVTPAPTDRFGRPRRDLAKVALGAEKSVPWEQISTEKGSDPFSAAKKLIQKLRKDKVAIIALEQSPKSINYKNIKPPTSFALIVGSEIGGLPKEILNQCDEVVEIPMRGKKESLNVSVATGIALFRILNI